MKVRFQGANPFFATWLLCLFGLTLPALGERALTIAVKPGLQFDPKVLHALPGEEIALTFDNTDEMMHNFVLVGPNSRMEIVESALSLGSKGPELQFVPESDKVLASTPVILPGKNYTIRFKAPMKVGSYPYVCTFPGHGLLMHGVFRVSNEIPKEVGETGIESQKNPNSWQKFQNREGVVIHRTFMPDSSPAAIAVSLPNGLSYCWDAGPCRFRYAWKGGFIRKNGNFGRWRTLPTIVGQTYHSEEDFPFFETGAQAQEKTPVSFLGYSVKQGIPEFHYQRGSLSIRESIRAHPDRSGLIRTFAVEGASRSILWPSDPNAGVALTFNKGQAKPEGWALSPKDSESFEVEMIEIPKKHPLFRHRMNDLSLHYNKKGDLHPGAFGQSWLIKGGKAITPEQPLGNFGEGATLCIWIKLKDPTEPVHNLLAWELGGGISYMASEQSFAFGRKPPSTPISGLIFEAEKALLRGPSPKSSNGGYLGSGYADFGTKKGEFIEWKITLEKEAVHRLRFRYASSDKRPLLLNVEGQITASHTLPFPNTGGWTSWATQDHSLHFTPGIHTIRLTAMGNAGPNLDRLEVTSMDRINKSSPLPETSSMQSIDDQWHMLALSLNEQTASLYLDGIILSKSPFSKFSMPSGKIVLNKAAAKAQYYLDELRVYERALSSEEINHLFRQGKFIDEG